MLPQRQGNATGSWPSGGQLRYPKDLAIDKDTDYVELKFYRYTPPFSEQGFDSGGSIAAYNRSASGLEAIEAAPTLQLYMPEDVGVKYGANWGDQNISNFGRAILRAGGSAMSKDFSLGGIAAATLEPIGDILQGVGEGAGNFITKGTGVIKGIQETLSQTNLDPSLSFDDVLGGITGQILNPNTEVLYKGPQMRGFGLSFKMAPRNFKEAEEIKKIIQTFKFAILPKFNGDASQIRSFVGVPSIVDVTFRRGNEDHPYVTQFKPCAITGFDVSYTPDGAWATYKDGQPVATTISIEFKELKMLYAEEINNDGATY